MSWTIETLIMNRLFIKETHNFESDDYNNLLVIEKKAKELFELGIISLQEAKILNMVSNGMSPKDISIDFGLVEVTILQIFRRACEKISFCLGGEFTDFGTLDDLATKHNLTEEQIDNLIKYTNSEHRHKVARTSRSNE